MSTSPMRAAALCALLASTCLVTPAVAGPYKNRDANGVDLTDGSFNFQLVEGSIGAGESQLVLTSTNGKSDLEGYTLVISTSAGTKSAVVNLGDVWDNFTLTAGPNSTRATGATLTSTGPSTYVYRRQDGTTITFTKPVADQGGTSNLCDALNTTNCVLLASGIVAPSGKTLTMSWGVHENCPIPAMPDDPLNCTYSWRLASVQNHAGYRAAWTFVSNSAGAHTNPGPDWYKRSSATLSNTAVAPVTWPTIAYSYPSTLVTNITTTSGDTWRITRGGASVTGVKRPGASSDNITVAFGTNGVSSVTNDGVTTAYNRTVSGTTATTVVTNALSQQTTIVSDMTKYRPTQVTDSLGKITAYAYDANGRLTQITYPEGNKTVYAYDTRGNVTSTTAKAKSGSGLADIATTASFPASCTNPVTCNQPDWTKDAKGNQTDYVYNATTGLVTTVTAPAPTPGANRPQTRYSYTTTGGVVLLTGVSTCQTGTAPSCVGTADEVKAVIGYDANRQPTTVSQGNGTGTLTATVTTAYDAIGNPITVDGPLAGTADTTRTRYDNGRRVVGVIGPDPDGAGSRKHKAQKLTYNADGQVTLTETGTVNSQSDADWTAFAASEKVTSTYDANARKTKDVLGSGSTSYSVMQYTYDALGRLDCSALRMNSSVWGSLPASACTPSIASTTFGPDRITKTNYDAVGRVNKLQTAYGIAGVQSDETTSTFTDNGKLATFTDAEGNRTTYAYDGHDRLTKTRYPSKTTDGVSSTTDYEQPTYDANGNVTNMRLRDGQNIGYTYDALNRVTFKDVPNSTWVAFDVNYTYDLLSRLTSATDTNTHFANFTWDALGRKLTETSNFFGRTHQYDLAGRRTKLSHSDGFYVDYDYDVAGNMLRVKENGASSGVGVLATYAYDDLGRRTSLTRGNGTVASYGYDNVSRLTSLGENFSGTTYDFSRTFTVSPAGQIATLTNSKDVFAIAGLANKNLAEPANGLNQLTAQGGTSLGYDNRGNVTSYGSSTYIYSAENRLGEASTPANFGYDPLGRMHWINQTITLQYDGWDMIAELVNDSLVTRRYVFGAGVDEPLVWYEGSGTTDRRFLHADERGSIIAVSNSSGTVTNVNTYDEYGQPGASNVGRFQYTGQSWVPELGMYYYKARVYNPKIGRFMQPDPIGYQAGMNLYGYVSGDPLNLSDPLGLQDDGPPIVVTGHRDGLLSFGGGGRYTPRMPVLDSPGSIPPDCGTPGSDPEICTIVVQAQPSCPEGGSITISPYGFGLGGTLFGGLVGLSAGFESGIAVPKTSLAKGSFRGSQLYVSGSFTPLAGFGAFLGGGFNMGAGYSPEPLQSGSASSAVHQAGAAHEAGGEISFPVDWTNAGGFSVNGGPRGAEGAYSAVGRKFSYTLTTSQFGCR